MPPKKTNKQREKLEQSQASSRARAQESLRAFGGAGFIGFGSFAATEAPSSAAIPAPMAARQPMKNKKDGSGGANPFAAFAGGYVHAGSYEEPGAAGVSAIYDGSDVDIALALKMLGKKGTVTKIKALNAFLGDILPAKKAVEVRGMVGHFVQLYTFEIRDQRDRKVRQLLNELLLALATKLRPKAFVPHLRRLLPYWLMAMHDPNPEAATAASKAMDALFPENPEMQAEIIITHLDAIVEEYTIFFQHTPNSFPGATLQDDEKEERYERCVTAAVLSIDKIITLFAATGNSDKLRGAVDGANSGTSVAVVLSGDKFGRLVAASSKNPNFSRDTIRKATYKTLRSLCEHAGMIIAAREEYFGKLVLGILSDKCPANQGELWELVLTFLKVTPSVWTVSEAFPKFVKSAVLPRLFAQIRHGFFGAARASFPMVLPLLSMFPLQHVVDGKSGASPLLVGVLENTWKYLVSNESRYHEDVAIASAFEILTASFDLFWRTAGVDRTALALDSDAFIHGYVSQFKKPIEDSLVFVFSHQRLTVSHATLYTTHWSTMVKSLGAVQDAAIGPLATAFLASLPISLLTALETLTSNTANLDPARVTPFFRIRLQGSPEAHRAELVGVATRLYKMCLEKLATTSESIALFDLMQGLYELIGVERILPEGEDVSTHYQKHILPFVASAGSDAGGDGILATSVLAVVKYLLLHVADKKAFVRQLFQDFGVQYGDITKATTIVSCCFQHPLESAGASSWLTTGSVAHVPEFADGSAATPAVSALSAIWNTKLLDEFVMISLKGRLDDVEADAFSVLVRVCLGGQSHLPVVTPDVVVILSHFLTQQEMTSAVVMKVLPSLLNLFAQLNTLPLPAELESAQDEVYSYLFKLTSYGYDTEVKELWSWCIGSIRQWPSERREAFIDKLARMVNDLFATSNEGFTTRRWASHARAYLQFVDSNDKTTTAYALIKRLSVCGLRFDGSRTELIRLYDRLLGSLAELCEYKESAVHFVDYIDSLFRSDPEQATAFVLRLLDIDVSHRLTLAMLESDFTSTEVLSLHGLWEVMGGHEVMESALKLILGNDSKWANEEQKRRRRVVFTNQHTEAASLDDGNDLGDLFPEQICELDRRLVALITSRCEAHAIQAIVKEWLNGSRELWYIGELVDAALKCADDGVKCEFGTLIAERCADDFVSTKPSRETESLIALTVCIHFSTNVACSDVHERVLSKVAENFTISAASDHRKWVAAVEYVTTLCALWKRNELGCNKSLETVIGRVVRVLIMHALAGKQDISEVASLRVQKRSYVNIIDEEEETALVNYSRILVEARRCLAELVVAAHDLDGGESLQELATHHREALLSSILVAVAESLDLKARMVSVYVGLTTPAASFQTIMLSERLELLLHSSSMALPVVIPAIHDTVRVRTLLVEAFGKLEPLATALISQDAAVGAHVRVLLYVLCTHTTVFLPSASASAGINLDADDEAATEAALARSIIPVGLRKALKTAFGNKTGTAGSGRRSQRRRGVEHDELLSQLLVWDLFLQLFPTSGGSSVVMISSALSSYATQHGLLSNFLNIVGSVLAQESSGQLVSRRMNLVDKPLYDVDGFNPSAVHALQEHLEPQVVVGLAARTFFRTVIRLPAMVRTWWNDECTRSLRSWATRYFEEYITPYVLASELEIIQKASSTHSWDAEEMSVKGSKVSREITTTYVKDECALEMVIRVPSSYPLRSVEVECTRRMGITEDRWRRWVLQIIKVTSAQDGSLLDAVLLWKQNVDKEFEGVEPCPICYSILNPKTMGLPNLSCKTCANKYHNSCLYKWFNQSGKNKCPICQQPFT